MENIINALRNLDRSMSERDQSSTIHYSEFLRVLTDRPSTVIRNVFQVFHDMTRKYVGEGLDEYSGDPETINFINYDCSKLFVEDSDHPFFADRLFANRLINHIEALRRGAQQNKIYIFDGPPGCGKSTFLNNLLMKFEEYANTEDGLRFEVVWRLDRKTLGGFIENDAIPIFERFSQLLSNVTQERNEFPKEEDAEHMQIPDNYLDEQSQPFLNENYIEVPCPSHDHPILMIPKNYRRPFFDDLFLNDEFKWKLFTDKEYDWVFRDNPCTICSSLYEALLNRLKTPMNVFKMICAHPYRFNRRLGEGISVFNPGDKPTRQNVFSNAMIQRRMNSLLRDSNQVKYFFSRYAKTNNGIYALMDIKSNNIERLIELHNIISEAVHKVEDIEENVTSLFLALMNPEDKKNIQGFQSFSDRIEYIKIPYVLDLNTEVNIYRNIFGRHIDESFLPRALHNFARVIISSRLNIRSEAMLEWIGDPKKYDLFCDANLQLLKMEIYTGYIPTWLSEEDRKRFTAKRRRKIIAESENEGEKGFSGRDSIKIFNEFYSTYAREDRLINMAMLYNFFTKNREDLSKSIPKGFLESLLRMYNYTILQEVKESLYYYNEEQISKDIQNYLFAVNFEIGAVEKCTYTGEKLEITEDFFGSIESRLLGATFEKDKCMAFRKETQKEYTTKTLTQEILLDETPVTETELYQALYERYVHNLKEKVLDPFLENENFRQAIKDYGEEEAFKTYDKRIRDDVTFLIDNLCNKCGYTHQGAKEVCIYVIDNDLAKQFEQ
ncbi:MAG: serine protein kinase PrkA [Desulfobacterales bacterium]|nr:serine protein kinase PrkA [Desulfobacterales bacterium]